MKNLRLVLIVFLLLVAACTGGDAATTTTEVIPPGTTIVPSTPPSTQAPDVPSTDPPAAGDEFVDVITAGEVIRLSSTHRVANVPSDDVLNARRLPGAGGPLAAELDPAYSTFRFTGETTVASDGGTWMKIVLANPAVQLVFPPEPYEVPWGWVNGFYTEPLAEFSPIGGSCEPAGAPGSYVGDPASDYDQLIDLLLLEFAECSQLVVTLAQGDGIDHLGVTLPDVEVQAIPDGTRLSIQPPDSDWLQVLWPATELFTEDLTVYVARGTGGAVWIDLYGAGDLDVVYLGTTGQIVVNFKAAGGPIPVANGSIAANPAIDLGGGSWKITGYARPFEANMSTSVRNSANTVISVPVTGTGVNVYGPGAFSVMTSDWSETWGWFDFTVDMSSQAAGNYSVRLADDGGNENGPVVTVPIVVP